MFVWIVCVAGKVNDCCNGQLVFFPDSFILFKSVSCQTNSLARLKVLYIYTNCYRKIYYKITVSTRFDVIFQIENHINENDF